MKSFHLLILKWYNYGTVGLRFCRHCVAEMVVILGFLVQVSSHGTIRNWLCKTGHYQLQSTQEEAGN